MKGPVTIYIGKLWVFQMGGHQSGSGVIKCLFALIISMSCDRVLIFILKVKKKKKH